MDRSQAPRKVVVTSTVVAELISRGMELIDTRRYQAAIDCFDRAIGLQPEADLAWYGRGDALANLQRYAEALICFERASTINPDNPEAWTFQGVVLIYLQRYHDALACCERAIGLQPHNPEPWVFRGVALQRLGRYRQAYASYNVATKEKSTPWWRSVSAFQCGWMRLLRPGRNSLPGKNS